MVTRGALGAAAVAGLVVLGFGLALWALLRRGGKVPLLIGAGPAGSETYGFARAFADLAERYLLDEEDIGIVGVSGTSAGAMNAVVLAEGILEGGRPQARS